MKNYDVKIPTVIQLYDNGLLDSIYLPSSRRSDIRDILINPMGLGVPEDVVDYWLDEFEVF